MTGVMDDEGATPGKLSLWRTLRESYVLGFGHLKEVTANAVTILAALLVIAMIINWVAFPTEKDGGGWLTIGVLPIASILFTAMVAVPWHRFVLDGEPLSKLGFTLDPRIGLYAIWGCLLSLPLFVGLALALSVDIAEADTPENDAAAFRLLVGILLEVAYLVLSMRLWLKLVAIAIDDRNGTLSVIWRSTAWNTWRVAWGSALTLMPALLFGAFAYWLETMAPGSRLLHALLNAASTTFGVILGMVSLTFLSLSYRHFMRAR